MNIFLQLWGGIFYLLAKVFLSKTEGKKGDPKMRLYGWVIYLAGVPAWLIALSLDQRWIALAVEAGGIPAMILGINSGIKNPKVISGFADNLLKIFTIGLIVLGTTYSIKEFGGINKLSQVLEIGITVGFLIGTYLLAKKDPTGWLCFLLMNISMGTLMAIQGIDRIIFVIFQGASIYFVIDGYTKAKLMSKNKKMKSCYLIRDTITKWERVTGMLRIIVERYPDSNFAYSVTISENGSILVEENHCLAVIGWEIVKELDLSENLIEAIKTGCIDKFKEEIKEILC